jgi:hypothetical protein
MKRLLKGILPTETKINMSEIAQIENSDRYSIFFLPFIRLSKPVVIGDIEFSDINTNYEAIFKECPVQVRDNFIAISAIFKNHYELKSIRNVGVAKQLSNGSFKAEKSNYKEAVTLANTMLAYAAFESRGTYRLIVSDNFDLHNFYTTEQSHGIVNFQSRYSNLNAVETEKAIVINPYHVFLNELDFSGFRKNILIPAFDALHKVIYSRSNTPQAVHEARRIVRAIQWINNSNTADPHFNSEMLLLFAVIGLETLLDLPGEGGKKGDLMSHSIELLLGESEHLKRYCGELYEQRNKIAHKGESTELRYKNISSHVEICWDLFDRCLKRKLFLLGHIDQEDWIRLSLKGNIDSFLKPNNERITEMLKISMQEVVKKQAVGDNLYLLLHSLNRETDASATKEDIEKAIKHISGLIIYTLENNHFEDDYLSALKENGVDYETEKVSLVELFKKVVDKNEYSQIEHLSPIDSYDSLEKIPKYPSQIKHLGIKDWGHSLNTFYYFLSDLNELYQQFKYRLK